MKPSLSRAALPFRAIIVIVGREAERFKVALFNTVVGHEVIAALNRYVVLESWGKAKRPAGAAQVLHPSQLRYRV